MSNPIIDYWRKLPIWGKVAVAITGGGLAWYGMKSGGGGQVQEEVGDTVGYGSAPVYTDQLPTISSGSGGGVTSGGNSPITTPIENPSTTTQPTIASTVYQEPSIVRAANPLESQLNQPWVAPITAVVGGVGGGLAVAENPAQLMEVYKGGSKNMGGNYALDFRKWQPADSGPGSTAHTNIQVSTITGKSGTVEQQLSGMSQEQKLNILNQAGLTFGSGNGSSGGSSSPVSGSSTTGGLSISRETSSLWA